MYIRKTDTEAAINAFGKNERVKKVFRTLFIAMAGLVLALGVDPVTAQQVVGMITGMGGDDLPPHLSLARDSWNMRVCIPGENKPKSGSVSYSDIQTHNGKPRKSPLFCSCGEYVQISL
jgi:hypothetical protein